MRSHGYQSRLYYPQYISGYEKVKMSTTNRRIMTEMEQRIKMRHAFAMSSFARLFTPNKISCEMRQLCKEWAELEEQPPAKDLYLVDCYFLELWKKKRIKQLETENT